MGFNEISRAAYICNWTKMLCSLALLRTMRLDRERN